MIHVTARAIEWLKNATKLYGNITYTAFQGQPACFDILAWRVHVASTIGDKRRAPQNEQEWYKVWLQSPHLLKRDQCSHVEDVRYQYMALRKPWTVPPDYAKDLNRDKLMVPVYEMGTYSHLRTLIGPTCTHCEVLQDEAVAIAKPKDGKYPVLQVVDTYDGPPPGIWRAKVMEWRQW